MKSEKNWNVEAKKKRKSGVWGTENKKEGKKKKTSTRCDAGWWDDVE